MSCMQGLLRSPPDIGTHSLNSEDLTLDTMSESSSDSEDEVQHTLQDVNPGTCVDGLIDICL